MKGQRLSRGWLMLLAICLIEIPGNGVRGEEILVKDVPYLAQKAHID
jgi:hypothetical protein